ncbi:MAG: acetamidase [Phycisphaera sp.]|nr:acetamidase [Phycisphaera sp.]
MNTMSYKTLHQAQGHLGWDNGIEPRVRVGSGESIAFEVVDASGGQITPESTAEAVGRMDSAKINPLTGPVYVDGAEPGDALVVELIAFEPSGWGWTALIPGFGLLADEFDTAYLHHSRYTSEAVAFAPGVRVPTRPFTGTIGVAPAESGRHSVIPPRRVGGNMDTRDLVAGSVLRLPVEVSGALLSVGDTHAAQGDGEVCGTAVETAMNVRLRVSVEKSAAPRFPQVWAPRHARPETTAAGTYITTGIGDDLMTAARDAVREMIDHIVATYGLTPELAYCLCSVAADLHISEVVDAPNWVVSAHLPLGVFA